MIGGPADRFDPLDQLGTARHAARHGRRRSTSQARVEIEVVGLLAVEPQPHELTDHLVGRELRNRVGRVHPCRMAVEPVARVGQRALERAGIGAARFTPSCHVRCSSFEQRRFIRLVAVQLEAGIADPGGVEAALDHFQRRHLLGDEEPPSCRTAIAESDECWRSSGLLPVPGGPWITMSRPRRTSWTASVWLLSLSTI
jgi:hypothetical protein